MIPVPVAQARNTRGAADFTDRNACGLHRRLTELLARTHISQPRPAHAQQRMGMYWPPNTDQDHRMMLVGRLSPGPLICGKRRVQSRPRLPLLKKLKA